MSMKYFNSKGKVVDVNGKYLEVVADTSCDRRQCVTIMTAGYGSEFQITGVTVHQIVKAVLTNSSLKTKLAVRDWLTRMIDKEND